MPTHFHFKCIVVQYKVVLCYCFSVLLIDGLKGLSNMQHMQLHEVENNLEHSSNAFALLWAEVHEREVECGLEANSHCRSALMPLLREMLHCWVEREVIECR